MSLMVQYREHSNDITSLLFILNVKTIKLITLYYQTTEAFLKSRF
jgi:hypothetical protein